MKALACLRRHALLPATLVSVVLGFTIGLLCRQLNPSPDVVILISFPGEVFLRMLKMMILPLVVSSIMTGLANLNSKSAGQIGVYTIIYYIATTLLATMIGLMLVLTIRPGKVANNNVMSARSSGVAPSASARDVFLDLVRNLFPENVVQASFQTSGTVYVQKHSGVSLLDNNSTAANTSTSNSSNDTSSVQSREDVWAPKSVYRPGMNMLGILSYFVFFGVILGRLGEKGKVVLRFFTVVNDTTIKMIRLILWYSPIGIMFLIMGKILEVKNLAETAQQLAVYIMTTLIGLGIHVLIVLPLLHLALTRKNPYKIMKGIPQAVLTVAATASSSATLPITIRCCEENLKINTAITRFVLPIGATINMDGTAIFQVISAVYIAQIRRIPLHFIEVIVLSLCTVLGSVGVAGVPNSAIMVLMVILSSVGLPVEDISVLLAVDWFLARMQGMVNITGDCFAASMLDHFFPYTPVEQSIHAVVEDSRITDDDAFSPDTDV
ncbi:excitatory amino acid transporter-like [Haliotis rufescens]|uniref:excitatory amino acid transporter-like n=1 Tax=Haliotis rufescens TaxID=6454 RepID=UPI00201ECAAE|nr:excitatory amino acid transporter-like [Haliotis rufescens]